MKKLIQKLHVLGIIVFSLALMAGGASASEKLNLMWGSTSQSSGLYSMNVAMGDLINKNLSDKFAVTVLETGGTADNFLRMEKDEVQLGQGSATDVYMANNGIAVFEGRQLDKPRFMLAAHPSVYVFAVTKASGVNKLADLQGKKYNPGISGGTTELVSRMIMKSLGISPDYYPGSTGEAVNAIKDRRIMGLTKSTTVTAPDTAIQDIQTVIDMRILSFSTEEAEKVKINHPEFEFITVPGVIYNQDDALTVGELMGICATKELSEEAVYQIVKVILENHDYIEQGYGGVRGQDMEKLTAQASSWLHPGTIRYLREKGYEIRKEQIPPEYNN